MELLNILHCPFCDSQNAALDEEGVMFRVACNNCGSRGPIGQMKEAVDMWNKPNRCGKIKNEVSEKAKNCKTCKHKGYLDLHRELDTGQSKYAQGLGVADIMRKEKMHILKK